MKLLIVEDEKATASSLAHSLARNGYAVDVAKDGSLALEAIEVNDYDLMILDLNLPDLDGLEVCRLAREKKPALLVLMLTARNQLRDVTRGLDSGADDYLTKPFHMPELLARLRALLRRDLRCRDPQVTAGDLCLDPTERVAWKAGRRLDLTRKEFAILEYLMRHPGEVISSEELIEHVWCSAANAFSNTVRVHIQSLRKKIGDDSGQPTNINTIVGQGYQFIIPNGGEVGHGKG